MLRVSTPMAPREQSAGAPARRRRDGRACRRLGLDGLLQLRGRRETRDLGRGDLDGLARLRVAALAGRSLGDGELPEPGKSHLVAGAKLVGDLVEGDLDGLLGLPGAQAGFVRDRLCELGLVDGCHYGSSCGPTGTARSYGTDR